MTEKSRQFKNYEDGKTNVQRYRITAPGGRHIRYVDGKVVAFEYLTNPIITLTPEGAKALKHLKLELVGGAPAPIEIKSEPVKLEPKPTIDEEEEEEEEVEGVKRKKSKRGR